MLGECCVCQSNLEDHLATLTCGHVFHYECILETIRVIEKCPLCQQEFQENQIIKLITDSYPLREDYLPQEFNDIREIIQLFAVQNRDDETPEEFRDLARHLNKSIRATKTHLQKMTQEIHDAKRDAEQRLQEKQKKPKKKFFSFFRRNKA